MGKSGIPGRLRCQSGCGVGVRLLADQRGESATKLSRCGVKCLEGPKNGASNRVPCNTDGKGEREGSRGCGPMVVGQAGIEDALFAGGLSS